MKTIDSRKNLLPAIFPMNLEPLSSDLPGLRSLINETIQWLQELLEEQNRTLKTAEKQFDVKSYLHYIEIPAYNELLNSDRELRRLASLLFSCNEKKIKLKRKPLKIIKGCSEIHVEIEGDSWLFYIKKSWEGAIKEALGLEFNNLLTDVPQRYLCSREVVVTERMFEPLEPETVYVLKESPHYAFAYGAWEVFTSILHMADRKIKNIRWNGDKLANIDFGLVFYRGDLNFDSRLAVPLNNDRYKQGISYAMDFVLKKIHHNREKMRELLLNLNSSFCRNLPCHRHPAVPLKIMINTLQKMADGYFQEALDPELRKEETCGELFSHSIGCFEGLTLVRGHIASSIFTTNGKILAQKSLPGCRFEKICPSVIEIVNMALLSVAQAGLGKCNFVQVNANKGILFAMWAIEEKLIIASLFDTYVMAGQAKMEMIKAVKKFVPIYEQFEEKS